ncbi:hybrid sensor histidine kinase/response regulator [Ideonella sp. BN130291]|uniref:hybrid sensor histidine kinase/response regulator n=1 Tax=Ideonella sp. BN130291 TaxID=3112940 RepID=UPI002E26555E|nr:ATP-binding protein [Ideonella sp. BN130291]
MLNPAEGAYAALQPTGDHLVRFYDKDSFLVAEVADFLDVALRAGDAAIVIATPQHRAQLHKRLSGIGRPKGQPGWHGGELTMLDARETLDRFIVDGMPDARLFGEVVGSVVAAAAAGSREVRAFGEMVALLCADGRYDAAVRLEEMWNQLGELHRFSLFCAYPMQLFASEEHAASFRAVCATHRHVRPVETLPGIISGSGAPLALATLQQRCAALEAEVARRRQAEATLRQRENELMDFLENAVECLHRVGPDGTILWANRAELDLLGYAPEEYIGHHISEFHADTPGIQRILQRLRSGETLLDEPAQLRCKDGSIRHVCIHSNACFDGDELRYTRCFTRDVTAQLRAAQEREQLLRELEAASRAKDEFLAMLGHELRNPLSPIVTALQLMKMRGDSTTTREQAIIERQVDHLTRLVDDLLDVSRITTGKVELRRQPVEMAEVLMKAVEMASPLLEQRRQRFTMDVPPDGLRCDGDPVRLAQVVSNLLTNAARYTPEAGDVHLQARREGERVVVTVQDNGIGISPEMLPQLFDMFFQGRRGIERKEGGLGLGLALVKSLVEMHGGEVHAHSEGPGRGSCFTVRLPLERRGTARGATQALHAAHAGAEAGGARVLVVDDNLDAAELLGQLLAAEGHRVKVVNDPAAALEALDGFTPDVALLDIGLPVMDGYELAIQLRGRLQGAPCQLVAVTGYGQPADRARSERAGFDAHLVKPLDPQALLRLMAECVTGR